MSATCRYYITDGSKFGADYLLYPGDPLLFHAQFTVRAIGHDVPVKPALLVGSARGSHAARKHLLLASVSLFNWMTGLAQLDDTHIWVRVSYYAIVHVAHLYHLPACCKMIVT